MSETWKPVVGYEFHYSVSDQGRVRRETGGSNCTFPGKIVSHSVNSRGYVGGLLCRLGTSKRIAVHRLVAAAFFGPCPVGKQVNHKNGIKPDNRVANLEYVTPKENVRHATVTGLRRDIGEMNPNAKLTAVKVDWIRRLFRHGEQTKTELAEYFKVGRSSIGRICAGRAWKREHAGAT
jgi:hypothetical protein